MYLSNGWRSIIQKETKEREQGGTSQQRVLVSTTRWRAEKNGAQSDFSAIAIVTFNVVGELASAGEIRLLGSANGYPESCGSYSLVQVPDPRFLWPRERFVLDLKKKNEKEERKRPRCVFVGFFWKQKQASVRNKDFRRF